MSRLGRREFLGVAGATLLGGCARTPPSRLPVHQLGGKIRHFVVLMMENRSYDEMLGALPGERYAGAPAGTRLAYVDERGEPASVELRYGTPRDQFYPDPPHRLAGVAKQIYGRGPRERADMGGFARAFAEERPLVRAAAASVQDYATHYADGQLPVLQTLAKEYGVCTHWFCSLPGPTTPNRMFAHAGTSAGVTTQGAYYSRVRGKMIFDLLGDDPALWRVYYHDVPHLWLTGDLWIKAFRGQQVHVDRFERDVLADDLPVYSFLEPRHVVPPWNSQHPFMGVSHGEALIARVYNALLANPKVFAKTLLLVVYDEHGGFYDHVVPPGHAGWSDGLHGIDHEVVAPSAPSAEGYRFDTLGPRVPAVVVSPWIERGSVFGWRAEEAGARATFDHTSILATVGCMTGVWVESPRARAATSLELVLNRDAPRADARPIEFREDAYRRPSFHPNFAHALETEPMGIAAEIHDAWREAHGETADAEAIAAHFRALTA